MTDAAATSSKPARKATKPANREDRLDAPFTERRITAQDGLTLALRDYAPAKAQQGIPVLCLAGLSRNSRDFHELASFLATDPRTPRRVVALDYRGRGYSDHDKDWRNYALATELGDVLDVLTALNLEHVIVVGTSRGGILAMLMGAARPGALRGVVLNDIGPQIEGIGLTRIRQYLRDAVRPTSWQEAADYLAGALRPQFPKLKDGDWATLARKIFREKDGRIVADFDPALVKPLESMNLSNPPPLWAQFGGLKHVPVLSLRGEHSDILSAETVAKMRRHHPQFQSATVPDSGHAPLLIEMPVLKRIAEFVASCH